MPSFEEEMDDIFKSLDQIQQEAKEISNSSAAVPNSSVDLPNPDETVPLEAQVIPVEAEDTPKKINSEFEDSVIAQYKKMFAQDDWYNEEKNQPHSDDGGINLKFKSQEDLANFALAQAETNQAFCLLDPNTKEILAYSKGDGVLYNGDGSIYEKGDFKSGTAFGDSLEKPVAHDVEEVKEAEQENNNEFSLESPPGSEAEYGGLPEEIEHPPECNNDNLEEEKQNGLAM